MRNKTYRLSPLAEFDLEGIWFYTRDHWSLAQADTYHRGLVAAFEALALGVQRGRLVDLPPGYRKHACSAHRTYFREEDGRVDIIRILHGKQDIERHLAR